MDEIKINLQERENLNVKRKDGGGGKEYTSLRITRELHSMLTQIKERGHFGSYIATLHHVLKLYLDNQEILERTFWR